MIFKSFTRTHSSRSTNNDTSKLCFSLICSCLAWAWATENSPTYAVFSLSPFHFGGLICAAAPGRCRIVTSGVIVQICFTVGLNEAHGASGRAGVMAIANEEHTYLDMRISSLLISLLHIPHCILSHYLYKLVSNNCIPIYI